jgi:hypothetical protein
MKEILGSEQVLESSLDLLQAGQISFMEYFVEMQFILDSRKTYLESEKEFFVLLSELKLKTGI